MNTPLMTQAHLSTAELLLDSMRQFVGQGKVVSIEEGRILRLAQQTYDEAELLDLSLRLLVCGVKENGVAGQRFKQLLTEVELVRAERLVREMGAA